MNYFRPGLEESITLPPYPKNSDEIGEVVDAVSSRTAEDVESIRNHDHEPFYAVEKYCKSKNIEFDRKAMREVKNRQLILLVISKAVLIVIDQ